MGWVWKELWDCEGAEPGGSNLGQSKEAALGKRQLNWDVTRQEPEARDRRIKLCQGPKDPCDGLRPSKSKEGVHRHWKVWQFYPVFKETEFPGCPGASLVTQMIKNLPAAQETRIRSSGWGRSPGGGHGNPLQYSCLKNPMDRGAQWLQSMGLKRVGWTSVCLYQAHRLLWIPAREPSDSCFLDSLPKAPSSHFLIQNNLHFTPYSFSELFLHTSKDSLIRSDRGSHVLPRNHWDSFSEDLWLGHEGAEKEIWRGKLLWKWGGQASGQSKGFILKRRVGSWGKNVRDRVWVALEVAGQARADEQQGLDISAISLKR